MFACYDSEQSALPGSVRPDHRMDAACRNVQTHFVKHDLAAKTLGHIHHL
jgi:hypothetical protein